MLANTTLPSCNFSSLPLPDKKLHFRTSAQNPKLKTLHNVSSSNSPLSLEIGRFRSKFPLFLKKGHLHLCQNSIKTQNSPDPVLEQESSLEADNGNNGGDWTTSFFIFLLYGGLMYYVFNLAPNQTPSTDMYLLKKLLFLAGDDGFQVNQVIVSLWNIMGLWPLLYSMLLIPTARSSKGKVPVWPFLILSFFLGAYALIPYFVLWRPPTPRTEEKELNRWPLNFLESKWTAGITLAAGLGLISYAGLASGDVWKEYFQYFRGSKLIHITSIDFTLLSVFAPFWVYNDITARKWNDKGFWFIPLSLIPFLGPALYVLLRPSASAIPGSLSSPTVEED